MMRGIPIARLTSFAKKLWAANKMKTPKGLVINKLGDQDLWDFKIAEIFFRANQKLGRGRVEGNFVT